METNVCTELLLSLFNDVIVDLIGIPHRQCDSEKYFAVLLYEALDKLNGIPFSAEYGSTILSSFTIRVKENRESVNYLNRFNLHSEYDQRASQSVE